jgi:hypothetical protein
MHPSLRVTSVPWLRTVSMRMGLFVLVSITLVAVVRMHALDHPVVHQTAGAAGVHEDHGEDGGDGGDRNDPRAAGSPAVLACAFIVLGSAIGVLRRNGVLRPSQVVVDDSATQLLSGPEPPVPRTLLVIG